MFVRPGILLFVLLVVQTWAVQADDNTKVRGKVLKVSGDVELINGRGEVRKVKAINEPVNEMDTIITRSNAKIVVQFNDGALSVLNEKSRMRVEKISWFSYLGGKIYFTFKKVFGGEKRHVRTTAATLGIRGTTFIISENPQLAGESVALKEGLLDVESNGPVFEIHRQAKLDEFAAFRQAHEQAQQAMRDEFDRYKKQEQKAFVEYRRQFLLKPNHVINLSGYRVSETTMSERHKKDFEAFETEAEAMIRAFREAKQ